jgi:hypothetical protein
VLADALSHRGVVGQELRQDLPVVEQAVEELLLVLAEGQHHLHLLAALLHEACSRATPGLIRLPPQKREELLFKFALLELDGGHRDLSPVLAVQAPVDDEADPHLVGIEVGVLQQGVSIEEVSARMPSHEGCELPCRKLMEVEHRNLCCPERAHRERSPLDDRPERHA